MINNWSFYCFPRQFPTCDCRYHRDDFHGHLALAVVVGMPYGTVVCFGIEEVLLHLQQVDVLIVHLDEGGLVIVVHRGGDGTAIDAEDGHITVVLAQLLQYLGVRCHKLALEGFRLYGEVVRAEVDDHQVGGVGLEVPLLLGTFVKSLEHLLAHGHGRDTHGVAIVAHGTASGVGHERVVGIEVAGDDGGERQVAVLGL